MAKNPPPPSAPEPSSSSSEEGSLSYSSSSSDEDEQLLTTAKFVSQNPNMKSKVDEKGEGTESESDDSDDEEEQPGSDSKKPHQDSTPAPPKSAPQSDFVAAKKPESSTLAPLKPASDSYSDSGSESEDPDTEAAKLEKPASSKPLADVLPVRRVRGSRKKSKDGKEPLNQLIWRQDDEIAVLKGMTKFQSQHGQMNLTPSSVKDTPSSVKNFLTFIKGSLSLHEVDDNQLLDKLEKLKKKYRSVASRANSRKELKFATEHNRTVYDLAKSVWGGKEKVTGKGKEKVTGKGKENVTGKAADDANSVKYVLRSRGKEEGTAMAATVKNIGRMNLKRKYPFLMVAVAKMEKETSFNNLASVALEAIDPEKANILEKKAKKQWKADVKLGMEESDLRKEIFKLIMEGIDVAMH